MTYINPRSKLLYHTDRTHELQTTGKTSAPINVEIDLSNRCSHGCDWCLTKDALLDILGRGRCSIADVRPGDCVLAYDENAKVARWAEVYEVSRRYATEQIYRIVVDNKAIEATGNHEVFTKRGWIDARHLTTDDEVAYVSEVMRMRLWSGSEVEGVTVLPGAWANRGNAARQQRTHEGQEPHETPRDFCQATGDLAGEWSEFGCIAENEGTPFERGAICTCEHPRASGQTIGAHEGQQPNEGCRCGSEGGGDSATKRSTSAAQRTAATEMAGSRVQSVARGAHEKEQPNAAGGSAREELERTAATHCCNQDGKVVCGINESAQLADLVFGPERVLGEGPQPRFQGTRPEAGDRNNGWLHVPQTSTQSRELLQANNSALRSEWPCVPGGDDARTPPQMDGTTTDESAGSGAYLLDNGQKCDLGFQPITSVTALEMTVEVFNLETATATYFANGLLVHNCHFAHTHTRGPLASREKPAGMLDCGDVMDVTLALDAIDQIKAAGVRSITWSGGGEPTLHPKFDSIISYAYNVGIEQSIYTNGGHIDEMRAHQLRYRMTFVYVSLDECNRDAFKASKGVDRFDAVLDGIRRLVTAPGPATIGVGFLLHAGNYAQIYHMVELGKALGVDYVQFRPIINYDQATPTQRTEDAGWINQAIPLLRQYAGDPFVVADVERFAMYRDWQGHSYPVCHWAALQTVITPNGQVWRCTNKRGIPDGLLGDLTQDSFASIWQRAGGTCQVNDKCRVLCRGHLANLTLDAIMTEPAHANFI